MSDGNQPVSAAAHDFSTETLEGLAQLSAQMTTSFQDGLKFRKNGDFANAVAAFDSAHAALQAFRGNVEAANLPPLDPKNPVMASLADAIDFAIAGDRVITALYIHTQATMAAQAAEHGSAAKLYDEASRLLEECAGYNAQHPHLASLWKAQAVQAEGLNMIRIGNNNAGQERLSMAIFLMHTKVVPHLDRLSPEEAGVAFHMLALMKVDQSIGATLSNIIKGDYGSALMFAEQIYRDVEKMRSDASPLAFPNGAWQKLSRGLVITTLWVNALEAVALVGKASEEQAWDIFEQQANMAKMRFVAVQQACLESEEMAPFSAINGQLIETLVEPIRRHGLQLRRLHKEMDEWKQSYRNIAGRAGTQIDFATNVQASAEARNKAEQTVSVQVSVATYFQECATKALLRLEATLAMVPADVPERDELLKKLAEVTSLPKDDPSWLDKVKAFTEGAQKVVGNVAKIVGPVASAWNMLAPLFGMPPLPISG